MTTMIGYQLSMAYQNAVSHCRPFHFVYPLSQNYCRSASTCWTHLCIVETGEPTKLSLVFFEERCRRDIAQSCKNLSDDSKYQEIRKTQQQILETFGAPFENMLGLRENQHEAHVKSLPGEQQPCLEELIQNRRQDYSQCMT